jgi:hypothetical protein
MTLQKVSTFKNVIHFHLPNIKNDRTLLKKLEAPDFGEGLVGLEVKSLATGSFIVLEEFQTDSSIILEILYPPTCLVHAFHSSKGFLGLGFIGNLVTRFSDIKFKLNLETSIFKISSIRVGEINERMAETI